MSLSPFVNGRFPTTRLRRMRRDDFSRRLMRETTLTPSDLILPVFVQEGAEMRQPVASMPGVERLSVDVLVREAREVQLLGIPRSRSSGHAGLGEERGRARGLEPRGPRAAAVRAVKEAVPELGVITDVALDPFTTHGQDGLIDATGTC